MQFNFNNIYPVDCISALTNELFFIGNFNGTIQAWKANKKKSINKFEFVQGYKANYNIIHPFYNLKGENRAL